MKAFLALVSFLLNFLSYPLVSQSIHKKGNQRIDSKYRFYLGADLSYVNELEDCGAQFRDKGVEKDVYRIFADHQCSIARIRIWHSANWTSYSNLEDVKKSIRRAKFHGMRVLLDFHYSDNWTDPARQMIPMAWREVPNDSILGDSVYKYTESVLMALYMEDLLPEMVQVGNEINAEILQKTEKAVYPIQWKRNVFLLNKGLAAVNAVSKKTKSPIATMLHIAQPDQAFYWFQKARENGIAPFDWIGLSYYTQWSKFNLNQLGKEIALLKKTFNKRVMIVEAGYPFTLVNADSANNLLDTVSQLPGYSISLLQQKRFMINLTSTVLKSGGEGVIYWEPAWISTPCKTQWAQGSHWDNATFFGNENPHNALPVFDFFSEKLYPDVVNSSGKK